MTLHDHLAILHPGKRRHCDHKVLELFLVGHMFFSEILQIGQNCLKRFQVLKIQKSLTSDSLSLCERNAQQKLIRVNRTNSVFIYVVSFSEYSTETKVVWSG